MLPPWEVLQSTTDGRSVLFHRRSLLQRRMLPGEIVPREMEGQYRFVIWPFPTVGFRQGGHAAIPRNVGGGDWEERCGVDVKLLTLVLTHLDTRGTGNRGHPAEGTLAEPVAHGRMQYHCRSTVPPCVAH